MKVFKNHSLKSLNAFHVDVKTKYLARITNEEELIELLSIEDYEKEKICVLGESSGTLFTKDFDGLVIKIDIKGIKIVEDEKEHTIVSVGAGEIWDDFVVWAIEYKLQGVENLSGIPGTVGAAPVQNIGAYGQTFEDVFVSLHAIDLKNVNIKIFDKNDLRFEYRNSVFKNLLKDAYIITKVKIQLNKLGTLDLTYHSRYESLRDELEKEANKPYSLKDTRNAVLNIRSRKFPDWKIHGNSGSYFKNPMVTVDKLLEIQAKFPDVQYYPIDKMLYPEKNDKSLQNVNKVKLAAGWLLDELGWKGKKIGNVGTSTNQALVIVNYNNANASEILEFANKMNDDFEKNFGIRLEPEVRII